MMVWSLFIIDLMGLFFYTKIGSIISIGDLPTTNIIEPIILGGDVFCYKNGQLKHTYDHWYYEKQDPTNDSSKSIIQTEKYISNYVKDHGEHYYFSIVLDNEEFNL